MAFNKTRNIADAAVSENFRENKFGKLYSQSIDILQLFQVKYNSKN